MIYQCGVDRYIDCTDPWLLAEGFALREPYIGDCMDGSIESFYQCTVWTREDTVVAVMGKCFN
jgi:hypothetical protein